MVFAELLAFIFHSINLSFTSGKSYLLRMIATYATERNLAVCVSAPTGKLAARYKQQLPNCRCNTVHSNFTIPVGQKDLGSINWSLSDIHVLLIDEVLSPSKIHILYTTINSPMLKYFEKDNNSRQLTNIFF